MTTDDELPTWAQREVDSGSNVAPPRPDESGSRRAAVAGLAVLVLLLLGGLGLRALVGGDDASSDETTPAVEDDGEGSTTVDGDEVAAENSDGGGDGEATAEPAAEQEAEVAVRPADNTGDRNDFGHWIGRNEMTAERIELVWAPLNGDGLNYRVHRFARNAGFDPETAPFSSGDLVYDGTETTVIDDGVTEGNFYTYVLDVELDGETLPRRWTQALAVDDTEPPTPVTGLTAELTDDGVLLSWDPSSDNVEFAAYSVSTVTDGDLSYIGGGADESQTSFLDNRPTSGTIVYSVTAVDFHDNRATAAEITVEVP